MAEGKHYVYRHYTKDNITFYVGKGSGNRAYHKGNKRSAKWKEVVSNLKDYEIEIVKTFINENDAYEYELELTKYYKSIGQCEANVNLGNKHSLKSKKKMSNLAKGKTKSLKTKNKISNSMPGEKNHNSKTIIAVVDGNEHVEKSIKAMNNLLKEKYGFNSCNNWYTFTKKIPKSIIHRIDLVKTIDRNGKELIFYRR